MEKPSGSTSSRPPSLPLASPATAMLEIIKFYGTSSVSFDVLQNTHFSKLINMKILNKGKILDGLSEISKELTQTIQSKLDGALFINITLNVIRIKVQKFLLIDAHFLLDGKEMQVLLSVVPLIKEDPFYIKNVVELILPSMKVPLRSIPNIVFGYNVNIDSLKEIEKAGTSVDSDFRIIKEDDNGDWIKWFSKLDFDGKTFVKCTICRLIVLLK